MGVPILDIVTGITSIIDKIIPDPQAKLDAKMKVIEMAQSGELKAMQMQTDINLEEARSNDPFKSRWRPMVGWFCAMGLGYQFLFRPIFSWIVQVIAYWKGVDLSGFPVPEELDMGTLMTLLMGMLGMGTLRTQEKLKNKD